MKNSQVFQNTGLGLIDLLLAVAISASSLLISTQLFSAVSRSSVALANRHQLNTSIAEMGRLIKTIGRSAKTCDKDAYTKALVCELLPQTPHNPTQNSMHVQFIFTPSGLEFQKKELSALNWTTLLVASEVSQFTLCSGYEMGLGQCTITPQNLSDTYRNLGLTFSFFRFEIQSAQPLRLGGTGSIKLSYQASFSVRNRNDIGLSYEGG